MAPGPRRHVDWTLCLGLISCLACVCDSPPRARARTQTLFFQGPHLGKWGSIGALASGVAKPALAALSSMQIIKFRES